MRHLGRGSGLVWNTAGELLRALWTQNDGWVNDHHQTWAYASGSGGGTATFTVAGDQTARYTVGTRIKLTQTTTKYFVVSADPSYDGTNTTVTITGGSDYTLANAEISANYHSYDANPQGYPGSFNFDAAPTGLSSPTTFAQFSVVGRCLTVTFNFSGTSTASTFTFTMPAAPANAAKFFDLCRTNDGNTTATQVGCVLFSGTTASIGKSPSGSGGFSTTGFKSAVGVISVTI